MTAAADVYFHQLHRVKSTSVLPPPALGHDGHICLSLAFEPKFILTTVCNCRHEWQQVSVTVVRVARLLQ